VASSVSVEPSAVSRVASGASVGASAMASAIATGSSAAAAAGSAVAVASGPEGEFVFNVTHRADLSFRDVIPTMPGFAARVTGQGDGSVHVAARDPEAEA
jgi:hypothetical protein